MTQRKKKNERPSTRGSAPHPGIYRFVANGMKKDKGGRRKAYRPCHWLLPALGSLPSGALSSGR
jgi:hypothetical protein